MRLRTTNNRRKAAIRRKFGHRLIAPRYRHEYARAWKRFENNAEGIFLGAYAFGCRGHPGIVTEVNWARYSPYDSDCSITSLIDGVEESCSIYHCGPEPISKEVAEGYAEYAKRHGRTMASLKFIPDAWKYVEDQIDDPECNPEGKSFKEYMDFTDEEYHAYLTGEYPE